MKNTDILRALLDERGIEHEDLSVDPMTDYMAWRSKHGLECRSSEYKGGIFCIAIYGLTPSQAVDATLGPLDQPPYEDLIEVLRRYWDIEASWNELWHFWRVDLTEKGKRKRKEAIDRIATSGRGECIVVSYTTDGLVSDDPKRFFHLSCGHRVGLPGLTDTPKFCAVCGRKVKR